MSLQKLTIGAYRMELLLIRRLELIVLYVEGWDTLRLCRSTDHTRTQVEPTSKTVDAIDDE